MRTIRMLFVASSIFFFPVNNSANAGCHYDWNDAQNGAVESNGDRRGRCRSGYDQVLRARGDAVCVRRICEVEVGGTPEAHGPAAYTPPEPYSPPTLNVGTVDPSGVGQVDLPSVYTPPSGGASLNGGPAITLPGGIENAFPRF